MTHNTSIVVLDAHALNPGDLDWSALAALGHLTIHPRTAAHEVLARCRDAKIVLTNKTSLTGATIEALPCLRYIGVLATGYNVVDTAAAARLGVAVTNIPAYGTASVAQHVFALLLELVQHTALHAETVRQGQWARNLDWCYWKQPLTELSGLTLGIVGHGRIGQAVARIAEAFEMNVLYATRSGGRSSLKSVFRRSHVVTLHCPHTDATAGMIDREALAWLPRGALLINTSRGALIDELALKETLESGHLGGAALDVLSQEPPPADHPLLCAPRCIVTPHLAWATVAARRRLLSTAASNLQAFLAGAPTNLVNIPAPLGQ